MISTVLRRDAMSRDDFDLHWREQHAPLAVRHHSGMQDYRQNPVVEVLTAHSPSIDSVAHMGFPTLDDFRRGLFDSPEGMKIIMDDTARFLALDRAESSMMGEYVLADSRR